MARVMMHAVSEQHVTFPSGFPQPDPCTATDGAAPRLAPLVPAAPLLAPQDTAALAPGAPSATIDPSADAPRASESRPIAGAIASTDQAKLAELVKAHFRVVWRTLRRLGLNDADADDGAQQVFLIVARKLDVIEPGKERSFLVGVSYRVAANARRAVEKHRHEELGTERAPHATFDNPEELLQWRQTRALLDEVLETMPLPQRSVFVLFELEGMTTPEIAESLDLPLGTAASRLRRARELFLRESKRVRTRLQLDPQQGGEP
jgi:RNA polymerase sigma-70 factor (ECF subfamily)